MSLPESFDPSPGDLHDLPSTGPAFAGEAPLTDDEALSLIRRYNAHLAHSETLRANAEALIKAEQAACDALLRMHGERLKLWTAARLRAGRRSVRTLEGVIGFRAVPERLSVVDEAAAVRWCREHATFAIEPKVNPKALGRQAYVATDPATGEEQYAPPPGFEVTPERQAFYIKPGIRGKTTAEEGED